MWEGSRHSRGDVRPVRNWERIIPGRVPGARGGNQCSECRRSLSCLFGHRDGQWRDVIRLAFEFPVTADLQRIPGVG